MNGNNKSTHILNTSSTLFGLCFVVLTSLKALKLSGETFLDEFTAVAMLQFMVSCILSFLSIRSNTRRAARYEQWADYIFLSGLVALFLITIFIVLNMV